MCVICGHRQIADLDRDLRNGVPLLQIEEKYGVARASLHRHRDAGHHRNGDVQAQNAGVRDLDTGEMEQDVNENDAGAGNLSTRAVDDVDSELSWLELASLELVDMLDTAGEEERDAQIARLEAIIAEQAAQQQLLQRELAQIRADRVTASVELVDTPVDSEPGSAQRAEMVPGMWLRRDGQTLFVPKHIPEAIARCLDSGWVAIPDPRISGM